MKGRPQPGPGAPTPASRVDPTLRVRSVVSPETPQGGCWAQRKEGRPGHRPHAKRDCSYGASTRADSITPETERRRHRERQGGISGHSLGDEGVSQEVLGIRAGLQRAACLAGGGLGAPPGPAGVPAAVKRRRTPSRIPVVPVLLCCHLPTPAGLLTEARDPPGSQCSRMQGRPGLWSPSPSLRTRLRGAAGHRPPPRWL